VTSTASSPTTALRVQARPAGFFVDVASVARRAIRQIPREPEAVVPALVVPIFFYVLNVGALSIDETTYSARLESRPLDLTYKEFELLKFLAQHPGRVFSRSHLVQEVWGYDYFGGTRTVDVHVRRLRAKLGPEHEALIGTVRNVGYKFVRPAADASSDAVDRRVADGALDSTDIITR
jgi:DNA-binding winged helix-turn-helix (wHTH) protein